MSIPTLLPTVCWCCRKTSSRGEAAGGGVPARAGRPTRGRHRQKVLWPLQGFATRLAERGFITFAPQNLYLFKDRFRTLQRKANPIKKSLFSVIVPQHQQIIDWLKTLPYVDPKRIGFYGLSYGGKSAMRIPPLVSNYCLSICSADFNDWVWKNASSRQPVQLRLDDGIRDFRVRPGQHVQLRGDGGPDRAAAVHGGARPLRRRGARRARGAASSPRCAISTRRSWASATAEIECFVGPHTINGKGTFAFLHKHLKWPTPGEKK